MNIKFNKNGIYLIGCPIQICRYAKAVNILNNTYWLPYNRTTLGRLSSVFSLANNHLNNYKLPNSIKVKKENYSYLRDYQYDDLCKIINMKSHVNFSEMRTGKTVTTIAWMKETGLAKWIVVAPKSVIVLTWEQEIQKWLPEANIYKAYSYGSTLSLKNREKVYYNFIQDLNLSILLVSKDTIKRDVLDIYINDYRGKKINNPKFKMNLLSHIIKDYGLVLDEATFLKNYKTIQSKVLKKISQSAEYTSCLTGTPTPKHPINIYAIMNLINSQVFHSYYNLAEYYFGTDYWGSVINSFRSEELKNEWIQWLSEFGVRHTQKEVMKWLPKIERYNVNVNLEKDQLLKYKLMKEKFTTDDGIRIPNVIAQFTKLKVIANSPHGTKKDFILEYLDSNPEEVIMIVSRYTEKVLKPLSKLLDKEKIENVLLVGETSLENRLKIVNKVNAAEYKVLLANRTCIKEGIKLPRVDTLIWFDKGSLADNQQVESRFLPTSEAEVTGTKRIISLITIDTVDEESEDALIVADELNDYLEQFGKE